MTARLLAQPRAWVRRRRLDRVRWGAARDRMVLCRWLQALDPGAAKASEWRSSACLPSARM